jgi:hypothetical protein
MKQLVRRRGRTLEMEGPDLIDIDNYLLLYGRRPVAYPVPSDYEENPLQWGPRISSRIQNYFHAK